MIGPLDKGDVTVLSVLAAAYAITCVFDVFYYWRIILYLLTKSQESLLDGYLDNQKYFEASDLDVDVTGKIFMITGATGTLGSYLSLELAKRGGTVHMVCRNDTLCQTVKHEIIPESGNDDIHCHSVDLSLISNIHDFASGFLSQHRKLDVLVHAASAYNPNRNLTSEDLDPDFIVNVMSNYLLTTQLLPVLKYSAQPRVIMISSGTGVIHNLMWRPPDLEYGKYYHESTFFSQKRQQIEIASLMANMTPSVHYSSVDPGWVDSPITRQFPVIHYLLRNRLRTAREGADTALWIAIADMGLYYESGTFYLDRKPVDKDLTSGRYRESPTAGKALITYLNNLTAEWYPDTVLMDFNDEIPDDEIYSTDEPAQSTTVTS